MPVAGYTPSYTSSSPYRFTKISLNRYLTYYVHRPIRAHRDDIVYKIDTERYVARPDLLAFDAYGDPDLWWVFGVRNALEDPVHDLKMGTTLIISPESYIRELRA